MATTTTTEAVQYRLLPRTMAVGGDSYRDYAVEFSDPGVQAAHELMKCIGRQSVLRFPDGRKLRIDPESPRWRRIRAAKIRLRHADRGGKWSYVDGQWRPVEIVRGPFGRSEILDGQRAQAAVRDMVAASDEVRGILDAAIPLLHPCAGSADGCPRKVAVAGMYCPRCAHDES